MTMATVARDAARELVKIGVTVQARFVRPGDDVEYTDAHTRTTVRGRVFDVVGGWVWHGGERIDTTLLVTDPVSGRGPVLDSSELVSVVYDAPDQTEPDEPAPSTDARDCTWW